ncbi:MAG: class I SAM-dependent methyltransferase [Oscillospiraceae bacterium]|nr:class I SAM-dependent methyltransferase [Oscillospiraceae bacterium]
MSSFWDTIAGIYDLNEKVFNRSVNEQMCRALENEIPKGAKVLDCAAGTGMLSMTAAKKAGKVLCTDKAKEMLIQAMKKARRKGVYNIAFARRDITALKDADNSFDIVIAGNVMHLLQDPEKAFSELVRVTKKGGKIIIPTYLTREAGLFFKLCIKIYKLLGYNATADFYTEEYIRFIEKNAEKNGCSEYSVKLLLGNIPAGFAVIKK